jgi:hypothetical protein
MELTSDFFKFGYMTPVFHTLQAYRTLMFSGAYNRLYINIPVLFGWVLLWVILSILGVRRSIRKLKEHSSGKSAAASSMVDEESGKINREVKELVPLERFTAVSIQAPSERFSAISDEITQKNISA